MKTTSFTNKVEEETIGHTVPPFPALIQISGYNDAPNRRQLKLFSKTDSEEPLLLVDKVMENIRKEVEKCDDFRGTIMTHSICGGTGSGTLTPFLHYL